MRQTEILRPSSIEGYGQILAPETAGSRDIDFPQGGEEIILRDFSEYRRVFTEGRGEFYTVFLQTLLEQESFRQSYAQVDSLFLSFPMEIRQHSDIGDFPSLRELEIQIQNRAFFLPSNP